MGLPVISGEDINREHQLARQSAESAVEHAIRCGQILADVKAALPHGQFGKWVEANCEFGPRRAQAYMKAAAKCDPRIAFDSVRQLIESVKEPQHQREPDALPIDGCDITDLMALRGQQFGCIYADPPWLYGHQGTRAATGNHYGGMNIPEICALPIGELAAPDSHLHLWTTNAFLFDARTVMEAWGFTYKSCFVWVKPQMGIGNYWRVSHEFMLFGIRGKAPFRNRGLMSWGSFDRSKHSQKPEEVRDMIQSASPGPYLELFARRPAVGWTVWGNEISRDLAAA